MTRPTCGWARSFGAALTLTSISTFVAMVAYSGPLGNATTLTAALAASPTAATWLLTSMSVGLAVAMLPAGALADQTGRRRVFMAGALMFAVGSVCCALATSSGLFIAGRIIEGLGAAGVIATGLGLVAAVALDATHRSRSAAWWGGSVGLGIAAGPLLTGLLDLGSHWSVAYWVLAAAGIGIAGLAPACFIESDVVPGRRLDSLGAALMTAGLTALLIALVGARQRQWYTVIVGVLVAIIALSGFTRTQLRRRQPMVDPTLLRHRGFAVSVIAAIGTGAGVIALMSFACTFATTAMGLTSLEAGAMLTLWSATSAISALALRPFALRVSGTFQLATGLLGTGAGLFLLTDLHGQPSVVRLAPGLLVAGVATGVLNGGLGRQAIATVPPQRAAVGTGINNTARYVGAAVGTTLVSILAGAPRSPVTAQVAGWNRVTVLAGVLSVATATAVGLLAARHPAER